MINKINCIEKRSIKWLLAGSLLVLLFNSHYLIAGQPSVLTPTGYSTPNKLSQFSLKANRDHHGRKIFMETEILVTFKKSAGAAIRSSMIKQYARNIKKTIGKDSNHHVVKLKPGQSVTQAIAFFKSNPNVAFVSRKYYVYKALAPNDTDYSALQWGLNNTGQTINGSSGTSGQDIGMEAAWTYITNCNSVTVAVIDTGINFTHLDLTNNMLMTNARDFVDADTDVYPDAGHESHGTNVTGIIGASGNNSRGTTGICWQVKIMPLRALPEETIANPTGQGDLDNVAAAITHAVDNGAKIINLSLEASGTTTNMNTAMLYAFNNNVVIVAAAGNSNSDNDATAVYPCNYSTTYSNVICVAAMDQDLKFATFSNRGINSVNVGAPGVKIYNTSPGKWIVDNMTGWTKTGAWAESTCTFNSTVTNILLNPSNYCSGGPYANNATDVAYKAFDLSSTDRASLRYDIRHNLQANIDYIRVNSKSTGGDPFSSGTIITSHTGSSPNSGTDPDNRLRPVTGCFTATCTIGFRLETDATTTSSGAGISTLRIETSERNANSYLLFSGTSQAAPHVSGLAAMILAWNPGYTATQIVNALKNGGVANTDLATRTTTGKVINAMGSLKYVNVPTNVIATVP